MNETFYMGESDRPPHPNNCPPGHYIVIANGGNGHWNGDGCCSNRYNNFYKTKVMKEQFVPYELAIELRNLGFDDYVFAFYWVDTKQLILNTPDYSGKHNGVHLQAPLWQQAFDFLWDKTGKYIIPIPNDDKEWLCLGSKFKTYEEARQACLEKLIELCQGQKEDTEQKI